MNNPDSGACIVRYPLSHRILGRLGLIALGCIGMLMLELVLNRPLLATPLFTALGVMGGAGMYAFLEWVVECHQQP